MISSTIFALSAPLLLFMPQFGEDEIFDKRFEISSDVTKVRAGVDLPIGFAVLGISQAPHPAKTDLSIIRTDEHHNILWDQRIGGADNEFPGNIIQTQDGGVLVSSFSFSTPMSDQRAVLIKFDEVGTLLWARAYRAEGGDSVSFDGSNWETRALVEELPNGDLILVSSVRGEYSESIAGVQHLLDSNGIPLAMWKQEEDWNLPVRLLYRDIAERDGKIVACGEVIRTMTPTGFSTQNSFVALLSDTSGSPQWIYEYPLELSVRDWADSIEFAANEELLVAGPVGEDAYSQDGYIMRLKEGGSVLWTQTYPNFPLTALVENVSLGSDSNSQSLIAMGTRNNNPWPDGGASLYPSMMVTDPDGSPVNCRFYTPEGEGWGMGLVHHHSSAGYSVDGVFGVSYILSGGGWPPVFRSSQYWLKADENLKTGCEEVLEQAALSVSTNALTIPLEIDALDGFTTLDWDPVTPDLEIDDLCEASPVYPSLCFGDGSGTQCPCGNTGGPGRGCANSVGAGAALSASGVASVSLDSLTLSVSGGTLSQPVLFFQGMNFINGGNGNTFGDGLRCCGGGVRRLEVRFMDASGSASTAGALSISGSVSAGSTYCNQGWYRDPLGTGGSPCSTYFNLTNAVSVTWAP